MNKTGKTILWIIIILIIIAGIWWGVSRKSVTTEKEPIKIGVITALSGDYAAYGEGMKNSILLAVNDMGLNDKVKIIIEDNRSCIVTDAVSAAQKLVNIDKVRAIIGPVCSSETLAILPITEKNKVILITPTATAKSITSFGGKFIFRTIASDAEKSVAVAKFANSKGYKKAALLYDIANESFIQQRDDFKETFIGLSGQIVIEESFKTKDADFRTQLTKIKGSGVDVVITGGFPQETGRILKQAKELGIDLQFMSTESSVGVKDLVDIAENAAEGLIFPFGETPTNQENQDFINAYKNKYGKDPMSFGSFESYDATVLLLKALTLTEKNKVPEDIRNNLYKVGQNYYGASGMITFKENGDVDKPMLIKVVKNGQFVPLENY